MHGPSLVCSDHGNRSSPDEHLEACEVFSPTLGRSLPSEAGVLKPAVSPPFPGTGACQERARRGVEEVRDLIFALQTRPTRSGPPEIPDFSALRKGKG